MEANEYQRLAMRTANTRFYTGDNILINAALGLSGESGEIADSIKKHIFHGHELNRNDFIKELGDLSWYIALACTALDINLSEVLEKNIKKLEKRYPSGFSSEASKNRVE